MKDCPCIGCKDRVTGADRVSCHSTCERYKEYRKPYEDVQRKRYKGRTADELLSDGRYKGYRKFKRGK